MIVKVIIDNCGKKTIITEISNYNIKKLYRLKVLNIKTGWECGHLRVLINDYKNLDCFHYFIVRRYFTLIRHWIIQAFKFYFYTEVISFHDL